MQTAAERRLNVEYYTIIEEIV